MASVFTLGFLIMALVWGEGEGHGRLLEPPARTSMWRFGFKTPADYTDNGRNCGGFYTQHTVNKGKCGICGDAYGLPQPRPAENGGKYGTGLIARTYKIGQSIKVRVELTAPHKGYFEVRVCPLTDKTKPATQKCLDKNVLKMKKGGTRYNAGSVVQIHEFYANLPDGLSCEHCVLQWKYRAGNNWGSDSKGSGIGFGPQEEFYNCADISISASGKPSSSNQIPAPSPMIKDPEPKMPATKYMCQFKDNPDGIRALNDLCSCPCACNVNLGKCSNPYCFCYPA